MNYCRIYENTTTNKETCKCFYLHVSLWVLMDSNHRSRKTADLQSAPFGHSGKHPFPFILVGAEGFEPPTLCL